MPTGVPAPPPPKAPVLLQQACEVRAGVSPSHRLSHDGDGDSWAVRPSALGSPAGTVLVRPGSERLRSLEGRQGRDRGQVRRRAGQPPLPPGTLMPI